MIEALPGIKNRMQTETGLTWFEKRCIIVSGSIFT